MFDLLGWNAEYEPSQINGWNPDFIIKGKETTYRTQLTVVEVKPLILIDEELISDTFNKYDSCKAHILLLSDFPFSVEFTTDSVPIGIGSQYYGVKADWSMEPSRSEMHELHMKCEDDFGSEYMYFDGMVYGDVDRKQFIQAGDEEYRNLIYKWTESANKIQFKVR